MRRWEIWQAPDGTETRFIPESRPGQLDEARTDGLVKLWETTAVGSNDAMRQMYDFLGWGDYKSMLREDGSPYPDDEDDRHAGPDHL